MLLWICSQQRCFSHWNFERRPYRLLGKSWNLRRSVGSLALLRYQQALGYPRCPLWNRRHPRHHSSLPLQGRFVVSHCRRKLWTSPHRSVHQFLLDDPRHLCSVLYRCWIRYLRHRVLVRMLLRELVFERSLPLPHLRKLAHDLLRRYHPDLWSCIRHERRLQHRPRFPRQRSHHRRYLYYHPYDPCHHRPDWIQVRFLVVDRGGNERTSFDWSLDLGRQHDSLGLCRLLHQGRVCDQWN